MAAAQGLADVGDKHVGKASAGLADVLITHIGQALGCSHTVSFDKGAVRWAGMTLLDLDAP